MRCASPVPTSFSCAALRRAPCWIVLYRVRRERVIRMTTSQRPASAASTPESNDAALGIGEVAKTLV